MGKLHFNDSTNGCRFDEPLPIEGSLGLRVGPTAVSIQEQDSASVAGKLTEGVECQHMSHWLPFSSYSLNCCKRID